jgi:hypothetical protein
MRETDDDDDDDDDETKTKAYVNVPEVSSTHSQELKQFVLILGVPLKGSFNCLNDKGAFKLAFN